MGPQLENWNIIDLVSDPSNPFIFSIPILMEVVSDGCFVAVWIRPIFIHNQAVVSSIFGLLDWIRFGTESQQNPKR